VAKFKKQNNKKEQGKKDSEIEILRLASDGSGVGYIDGKATFVPGLLPGEQGKVRIREAKKNFQRAEIISISRFSADRQPAPCSVYPQCGGCNLQHMTYKATLVWKKQWEIDSLQRIGGLKDANKKVQNVIGMQNPWRYRNKAVLHRDAGGRLGYYKEKSKDVVVFDDCLLLSEATNQRIKTLQRVLGDSCPEVKTVTFRENQAGKGMVIMHAEAESEQLEKKLQELKKEKEFSASDCILIITERDNYKFYERWGNLKFGVSPYAFLQVNTTQTAKLYGLVLEWTDLKGREEVWDLYCGIGTMTLMLAQKTGKAVGVEENPQAVVDAKENAKENKVDNVSFVQGRVEDRISALAGKPELVVTDPPRAGMDREALTQLLALGPARIIYVSCNPATLARDLKILTESGTYQVEKVQPVDMFAWSHHVETVCLMSRKQSPKSLENTGFIK